MADFRAYSDKYPFRMRSETPEIAIELSLQPWRSFGVDGVIMFSGRCFELEYVTLIFFYLHVSSSRKLIKMLINTCTTIRTDILTPLPAMGVDFEIIPGKGPKISNPVLTMADIDAIKPLHDVETQVPFLGDD